MSEPIVVEVRAAWHSAVAMLCLSTFGTIVALVLWNGLAPDIVRLWPWWTALGVSLLAALLLWIARARPFVTSVIDGVFIAIAASLYWATWDTNDALARAYSDFEAFEGFKLAALVIALVGPPQARIGFTCIIAAGALAGIEYALWPASVRAATSSDEPWSTLVYAAIGVIVYVYRLRSFELERRAARAEAEATARCRAARILAATGDLANSPLQTIELTIPLLRTEGQPQVPVMRIARASARLRHVSRLLEQSAAQASWQEGDVALDAIAILRDAIEHAERSAGPEPSAAPKSDR